MKKLFVSSAVALALASGALVAEESGGFIGLGVGYAWGEAKQKDALFVGANDDGTLELDGYNIDFLIGGKQFFTPEFGLRYYFNLNGGEVKKQDAKLDYTSYTLNADVLYNFIAHDFVSFGAFLGLGVGLVDWNKVEGYKGKVGFDAAVSVGLRTEIAKHHGIEIFARAPFTTTTFVDKDTDEKLKVSYYSGGLRYIYSFGD